ncbi:MAG: hypothetical protein JXB62_20430 [Pirellulales bacterium]|nr:hypothetical protein [Pirellulales bacterium]
MANEFPCVKCGRTLQPGDAPPGRRILCPGCGGFSEVPAAGAAGGEPIEFRCPQCNRLLRTPAETAGKQAKCPECGAIVAVPQRSAPQLDETLPGTPPPPPPPPGGGSPFEGGQPAGRGDDEENPYQAPTQYGASPYQPYGADQALAANRVSGPAIGLIVTGAIGMPLQIFAVIVNLMSVGVGAAARQPEFMPMMLPAGVNVVLNVVSIAIGVVVIFGGIKMKRLENYAFAMIASIIAMVPCFSPCCLLGLPFGIWALVVLADSQVKAAFRG